MNSEFGVGKRIKKPTQRFEDVDSKVKKRKVHQKPKQSDQTRPSNYNTTRIRIGDQFNRWRDFKMEFDLGSDVEVAAYLLDWYDKTKEKQSSIYPVCKSEDLIMGSSIGEQFDCASGPKKKSQINIGSCYDRWIEVKEKYHFPVHSMFAQSLLENFLFGVFLNQEYSRWNELKAFLGLVSDEALARLLIDKYFSKEVFHQNECEDKVDTKSNNYCDCDGVEKDEIDDHVIDRASPDYNAPNLDLTHHKHSQLHLVTKVMEAPKELKFTAKMGKTYGRTHRRGIDTITRDASQVLNEIIKNIECDYDEVNGHLLRCDEHLVKVSEHLVEVDEHIVKGDEHLLKGDEYLLTGDEHLVKDGGHLIKGGKHLVKGDVHLVKGDVHLVKGDKHLVKGGGHLIKGDKHLVKGDRHLVEGGKHLVKSDRHLVEGGKHLVKSDRHFVEGGKHLVKSDECLVKGDEHLVKGYGHVKSSKHSVNNNSDLLQLGGCSDDIDASCDEVIEYTLRESGDEILSMTSEEYQDDIEDSDYNPEIDKDSDDDLEYDEDSDAGLEHDKSRPLRKCDWCDYSHKSINKMDKHYVNEHPEKNHVYSCDKCHYTSVSGKYFYGHVQRMHESNKYKCDVDGCNFSTYDKLPLEFHLNSHFGIKPYKCDKCDSSFTSKTGLRSHKLTHMKTRKHHCGVDGCSFSTNDKSQLEYHRNRHFGLKPFKCNYCDRSFASLTDLQNHNREGHINISGYQCDVCGKQFKILRQLQRHKDIHVETYRYKCDQCPFKTRQDYNLKIHLRIHSGEKPYLCVKCGYQTPYPALINKHKCETGTK